MKDFTEKLNKLPTSPGVYLMKDKSDVVIYVGKAKNLKNRVRSYFRGFSSHTPKTQTLVINIDDFEYIITPTEVEALILEGNLIKKYKPRFNVMLKDDKSYPYIKITREDYPRVIKVRRVLKDGAKYYGPYTSDYDVNQTIDVIQKLFPIRQCNRDMTKKNQRPCLYYHIKQCLGPCKGDVAKAEYGQLVDEINLFLSGKQEQLIQSLQQKMQGYASGLNFEQAAAIRDQIQSLKKLTVKQRISQAGDVDQDIIALYTIEQTACIFILFVRSGLLIGREHFVFDDVDSADSEAIISQFLTQFYGGTAYIPKELLLSHQLADSALYQTWLSAKLGSRVSIKTPQRGNKRHLVKMAHDNAQDYLNKYAEDARREQQRCGEISAALQQLLALPKIPQRIEAFDISNIMGTFSVGSMVVYEDCRRKKSDYRRFKVKTIEGPNDYGSMMEVLFRRLNRALGQSAVANEQQKFSRLPDILLIDGGKGHVSAVEQVIVALGLTIPVVGMVKDDRHRTRGLLYQGVEYPLAVRSIVYRFIYEVQEEVHRFAITYHRSLRDKAMVQSILDDIPGIGKVRKTNLLKHFKTVDKIRQASLAELIAVPSINEDVAQSLIAFFTREQTDES